MRFKSWQILLIAPFFQSLIVLYEYINNTLISNVSGDNALQGALYDLQSVMGVMTYYILSFVLVSLLYFKKSRNVSATLLVIYGVLEITSGSNIIGGIFSLLAVWHYFSNEASIETAENVIINKTQ